MEVINVRALVLRVGTQKLSIKPGCLRDVTLHFDGVELKIDFVGSRKYKQEHLKWKYTKVELLPSRKYGVSYDTIQAGSLKLMYVPPSSDKRAKIKRILKPSKSQRLRQLAAHSEHSASLPLPQGGKGYEVPSLLALAVDAIAQEMNKLQKAKTSEVEATENERKEKAEQDLKPLRLEVSVLTAQKSETLEKFSRQEKELQEKIQLRLTQVHQSLLDDVEEKYDRAIEERRAFLSELPSVKLEKCYMCLTVRSAGILEKCGCDVMLCPDCVSTGYHSSCEMRGDLFQQEHDDGFYFQSARHVTFSPLRQSYRRTRW